MTARTTPAGDEEFLVDYRDGLRASIEYFSAKNKPERERWVCHEFLKNLGVKYKRDEVRSPPDDPPDVIFRSARFETKEVLDPGRKRHAEYKISYQHALEATDSNDLLTSFEPKDLTAADVLQMIVPILDRSARQYPAKLRSSLDILIYVNLIEHFFKNSLMPDISHMHKYGWRSISVVTGWHAMVLYAAKPSPRFLSLRRGSCVCR